MRNKIFIINGVTFEYGFKQKEVTLREVGLESIVEKLRDDHEVITNDPSLAKALSKYLLTQVKLVDIGSILSHNMTGFIVRPTLDGHEYKWTKVTPLSIAQQAKAIFKLRTEQRELASA